MKTLSIAFLAAFSTMLCHANVVYTYTGNSFMTFPDGSPTSLQDCGPLADYAAGSCVFPPPGYTSPAPESTNISGWFSLATPLSTPNIFFEKSITPLDFSFTDGLSTLTPSNTLSSSFNFSSSAPDSGDVGFWGMTINGVHVSFLTDFYGSSFEATDSSLNLNSQDLLGTVQGHRGSWTVPEPGAFFGIGIGLGMIAFRLRRRDQRRRI